MKWGIGLGGLICIAVLMGCSARKVHSRQIRIGRDSVVQLSADRAFLERKDRSIQLEWWGDAVDHLMSEPYDSIVSDSTSSGRGGFRILVNERTWMHADERTTNNVRMKQGRYEDDSASPDTTR